MKYAYEYFLDTFFNYLTQSYFYISFYQKDNSKTHVAIVVFD